VKLLGAFRNQSSLLLVQLPVQTWNLLPERAADRFVDVVMGTNILDGPAYITGLSWKLWEKEITLLTARNKKLESDLEELRGKSGLSSGDMG
jgi:hypothetical protein